VGAPWEPRGSPVGAPWDTGLKLSP